MNFKNIVRRDADKEASKKDLIEEYGNTVWIMGYPVNILLAIIGGLFDAAVIYSVVYLSLGSHITAIIAAIIGASFIQMLVGEPLMKIAKRFYSGDFEKKGYGKMLVFDSLKFFVGMGFTLFLSLQTVKLVDVALSEKYTAEKATDSPIKDYYNNQRALVDSTYHADREQLDIDVEKLSQQKVREAGVWVIQSNAKKAIAKIIKTDAPNLLATKTKALENLKTEEIAAIAKLEKENKAIDGKQSKAIIWGGNITKFANITINIIRAIILLFYMLFILDARNEIEGEQEGEQTQTRHPEQVVRVVEQPTRTVVRNAAFNNQLEPTEQAQSLVTQSVQPAEQQPNSRKSNSPNNKTGTTEQPTRTVVQGFQNRTSNSPPYPAEQPNNPSEQSVRHVVHEQKSTKVVINNTDLVNMKRKVKQKYLRSFFPSMDAQYQKRKNSPEEETLQRNWEAHLEGVEELNELGVVTNYIGEGEFKTVSFS